MEAEREVVNLRKAQFMQSRLGEEYDGIITGVATFGFFVELVEIFVEGMVPVAMLRDDYYQYVEKEHLLMGTRTGIRFRIGDQVRVQVARVDLERRQIEFVPAGLPVGGTQRSIPAERTYRKRTLSGNHPRTSGNGAAPGRKGGTSSKGRRRGR
jgi:ribonuclease R